VMPNLYSVSLGSLLIVLSGKPNISCPAHSRNQGEGNCLF